MSKKWCRRLAVKQALKSRYYPYRHGAIVERGGRILAQGTNKGTPKHHKACMFSLHAEVNAILKVNEKEISKAAIYVARVTRTGKISNSKPCKRCHRFLKDYGVKTVHYSIEGVSNWGTLKF